MSEEIVHSKTVPVLWSDLDPNGHMRGPRYLEYAAEMPFHFIVDKGKVLPVLYAIAIIYNVFDVAR